jgi:hypothetical protein
MGKHESYTKSSEGASRSKEVKLHPIWRGIGCLFMVLIPVMSWIAGGLILKLNTQYGWFPVPGDLMVGVGHPLAFAVAYAGATVEVQLIIAFAIALVLFVLFTIVVFMVNSMFGGSRYGAFDLPPVEVPRGVKRARSR